MDAARVETGRAMRGQRRTPVKRGDGERVARKGSGRLLPCRVGSYELVDHIGRGGMADIYLARAEGELGMVREVVVKEVLPGLSESERLAELLVAEAKTAARLEHVNIVRIEDLDRQDGKLLIAMEYVDGLDLRDLLRRASRAQLAVPVELSVRIVCEVLRALDHAHCAEIDSPDGRRVKGIVHRDVSPSNILLSLEGEVKVCDFGIARAHDAVEDRLLEHDRAHGSSDEDSGLDLTDRTAEERAALIEGKAGYMSPEQARGEPLDGRADVFAAGIVLWELLSGRRLYKAKDGESLLDVARRAHVPKLKRRGLPLEDELAAIVARALAPLRDERTPTAGALLDELEGWAARARMLASPLKLRRFLEEQFGAELRATRKRRRLATEALGRGAVATIAAIAPTASDSVAVADSVAAADPVAVADPAARIDSAAGIDSAAVADSGAASGEVAPTPGSIAIHSNARSFPWAVVAAVAAALVVATIAWLR